MESVIDDEDYRREMEKFVSNHGGSSPQEIMLILLPNICTIFLTSTIIGLLNNSLNQNLLLIIEIVLNIIPSILSCTILTDNTLLLSTTVLTISLFNFLIIVLNTKLKNNITIKYIETNKRDFITNFRALINIITSICILAVDFNIFPRKLAKTEIYGYSLMDTGVGLFVISNAIVSPGTKDQSINNKNQRTKLTLVKRMNLNAKDCIRNTLPLLVLGIGRSLALEFSGYQKHVSEYGVHWNFFITLAFIKVFTSTIASTISSKYSLFTGLWILMMHEYALSTKDLKQWVFGNTPRTDFVTANREGIISLPGYIGLYLLGVALGRLINSTYQKSNESVQGKSSDKSNSFEYNKSLILCIKFSLIASIFCGLTLFSEKYFGISRRLANIGYCFWILTLTVTVLTLLLLVEIMIDMINNMLDSNLSENKVYNRQFNFVKTLEIFEAINYNGLIYFLMSNLLTGLINMNIRTLYVEAFDALQILIAYMLINIFISVTLYRNNIKLKL